MFGRLKSLVYAGPKTRVGHETRATNVLYLIGLFCTGFYTSTVFFPTHKNIKINRDIHKSDLLTLLTWVVNLSTIFEYLPTYKDMNLIIFT